MQTVQNVNTITPEQFVYWLSGALELGNLKELNAEQVVILKQHLALVMQNESGNVTITTTDLQQTGAAPVHFPLKTTTLIC